MKVQSVFSYIRVRQEPLLEKPVTRSKNFERLEDCDFLYKNILLTFVTNKVCLKIFCISFSAL